MGKRRTGRKLAVQALYQADIRDETLDLFLDNFLANTDVQDETKSWTKELVSATWAFLEQANTLIVNYATGWDFDRINPIDKSILQVAFYELKQTDTPANIVVDEAIEIAKKYSTDDSPKFINGILGQYIKDTCSPDSSKN